ncbi:hypothetical protein DPMN_184657 [Dreissena polymorpha]|uniref:Uncharacterized protein n=1 Tax=Dreissena polymorpha TaxID=45954 RepID=A0A9D4DKS6_DREPO|nr:hypothetical protein DPMN_184657 [Dreissena polymorpha]
MARQRPTRLVMGPCIAEIDCFVIREVQYQFEVNRCRNEEIIVKCNFGLAWPICGRGAPGLVKGPCIVEIDRIVIRKAQYQFEVNQCRNEEVNFQGSSANSVGGAGGLDRRTVDSIIRNLNAKCDGKTNRQTDRQTDSPITNTNLEKRK